MDKTNSYMDDTEMIQQKAENISGLLAIILLFLDTAKEDKQLIGALKCLYDEIITLRDLSNSLSEKVFNKTAKGIDINE